MARLSIDLGAASAPVPRVAPPTATTGEFSRIIGGISSPEPGAAPAPTKLRCVLPEPPARLKASGRAPLLIRAMLAETAPILPPGRQTLAGSTEPQSDEPDEPKAEAAILPPWLPDAAPHPVATAIALPGPTAQSTDDQPIAAGETVDPPVAVIPVVVSVSPAPPRMIVPAIDQGAGPPPPVTEIAPEAAASTAQAPAAAIVETIPPEARSRPPFELARAVTAPEPELARQPQATTPLGPAAASGDASAPTPSTATPAPMPLTATPAPTPPTATPVPTPLAPPATPIPAERSRVEAAAAEATQARPVPVESGEAVADTPRRVRPALLSTGAQPVAQPQPQAEAALAMAAVAARSTRDEWRPAAASAAEPLTSIAAAPASAPHTSAPAPVAAPAAALPLDTGRAEWIETMIDHIDELVAQSPARTTQIRLLPDALGQVDVSIRKEGDQVHVNFTVDTSAAKTLISDATPRLAELADARGLKLGGTGVETGTGGDRRAGRPDDESIANMMRPRGDEEASASDVNDRIA